MRGQGKPGVFIQFHLGGAVYVAVRSDEMAATYSIDYRKHDETYRYNFTSETRRDALHVIGRQACNPDLSLDWRDAWKLERRIRRLCNVMESLQEARGNEH